nr:uncharacterized protein LOC126054687 [Helicoverpa armigera]
MPRVQRTPPPSAEPSYSQGVTEMNKEEAMPRNSSSKKTNNAPSRTAKRPRTGDSSNTSLVDETASDDISDSEPHLLDDKLLSSIRLEIKSAITTEMNVLLKTYFETEFVRIKDSLKSIDELKDSVNFMSQKFDEVMVEHECNKETIKQLKMDNESLKKCVTDLSVRVNMLEQFSRQDNIEVNGIPENKSENLLSTIMQLGNAISYNLQENDILHFSRIRKLDSQSDRPRSVVVKLRSSRVRDEILASVIKFNRAHPRDKLNSTHLGYGGTKKPVFVSEHLSPINKAIHAETRKIARAKGYKYVWVRDGRILVRKDDGSNAKQIKSLDAISLL